MRLGVNTTFPHKDPEEWAKNLAEKGYRASRFPVTYRSDLKTTDEYLKAAAEYDIMIAEVGVWNSPHDTDPVKRQQARDDLKTALEFADYVKAKCCVNISGAAGPVWNLLYKENYAEELYEENVRLVQDLLDAVKPKYTTFALEPMQWMLPDSPEQYAQFLKDVDRPACAAHMDASNFLYSPRTFLDYEGIVDRSFDLLGDRIISCHLKDIKIDRERYSFCLYEVPLGDGVLNLAHYIERIEKLDPDMPVLFEHWKTEADFDKCLNYMKERYADRI